MQVQLHQLCACMDRQRGASSISRARISNPNRWGSELERDVPLIFARPLVAAVCQATIPATGHRDPDVAGSCRLIIVNISLTKDLQPSVQRFGWRVSCHNSLSE